MMMMSWHLVQCILRVGDGLQVIHGRHHLLLGGSDALRQALQVVDDEVRGNRDGQLRVQRQDGQHLQQAVE